MSESLTWPVVGARLERELGARGYPVPSIVWLGMLDDDWHVVVQNRLPGHPLWPLTSLSGPMLESLLRLVELQADAGVPAGDRDFIGYVADVLFDDWDDVWRGPAPAAQTRHLLTRHCTNTALEHHASRQPCPPHQPRQVRSERGTLPFRGR